VGRSSQQSIAIRWHCLRAPLPHCIAHRALNQCQADSETGARSIGAARLQWERYHFSASGV